MVHAHSPIFIFGLLIEKPGLLNAKPALLEVYGFNNIFGITEENGYLKASVYFPSTGMVHVNIHIFRGRHRR